MDLAIFLLHVIDHFILGDRSLWVSKQHWKCDEAKSGLKRLCQICIVYSSHIWSISYLIIVQISSYILNLIILFFIITFVCLLRYWVCWLSSVYDVPNSWLSSVCDMPNNVMRCACCGDDGCVYKCYTEACAVKWSVSES